MKHSPQIYAKALSDVLLKPPARRVSFVKNLLLLVKRNNDQHLLNKIYGRAESIIRERMGRRKIIFETAREINNFGKTVSKIIKKKDIVDYRVNSEIIAGLKIIINDEAQFDGSMQRKIKKLFK